MISVCLAIFQICGGGWLLRTLTTLVVHVVAEPVNRSDMRQGDCWFFATGLYKTGTLLLQSFFNDTVKAFMVNEEDYRRICEKAFFDEIRMSEEQKTSPKQDYQGMFSTSSIIVYDYEKSMCTREDMGTFLKRTASPRVQPPVLRSRRTRSTSVKELQLQIFKYVSSWCGTSFSF